MPAFLNSLLLDLDAVAAGAVFGTLRDGMTGSDRVVFGCTGHLASELFQGFAFGLGDEEGGEDTEKHYTRVSTDHTTRMDVAGCAAARRDRSERLTEERKDLEFPLV